MICSLNGKLIEKRIDVITVEACGVGYEVFIPLKSYSALPETGSNIFLFIQTIVKEDGFFLYGFLDRREREVFNFLRMAKGVGVKTAYNLLSSLDGDDLVSAIASETPSLFEKVPGIGKKTAERIVFELKDKVRKYVSPSQKTTDTNTLQDVELALVSLGYSVKDAREVIRIAEKQVGDSLSIEEILKASLRLLVKR